jgi:RNA polymerase sigma factor (sigma-70 family)
MLAMNDRSTDHVLIQLIERVAERDQGALKQLYELSSPRLYGLALRVVSRPELAEDVLQEAFLNVWRIAADYRRSLSPPMAWLGLIVRSRALDLLRRRASERADEGEVLSAVHHETIAGQALDPMDSTDLGQQASALRQCLSRLEANQREVVSLAYLRDLSHGELAAQLKLPLGTVKTWIRRGLAQLRGCMARFA